MADEDITLDGKPLQSLRVADLKAALEQRNLPKSGQKNTLIKRLKGALMLENLQKSSSSHSGLQPNSQIGEEMSQNSFIQQYLAKQQELLRQRLEREAQNVNEADESPAVPEEDEDHSEDNDSSPYISDKHHPLSAQPSMTRAEARAEDAAVAHGMMGRGPDFGPSSAFHPQGSFETPSARIQRASFHHGRKEPPAPSPPRAIASLSVRVLGQPDRQGLPPTIPRAHDKEGTAPSEPGSAHPVLHLSRSARVSAGAHPVQDDEDDDDSGDDESEDDEDWGPGPGGARKANKVPPQPQQMLPSVPPTAARSKRKLQPPQHIPPPQAHHNPMQLRHPTPPPSPPPDLFPLPDTPKQSPPDTNDQEGEGPGAAHGPRMAPFPPSTMQRQDSDSSSRSSSPEPTTKRRPGPLSLLVHKMESEGAFQAAEASVALDMSGGKARSTAGPASVRESPLQKLERQRVQENREMAEGREQQEHDREQRRIQEEEQERKRMQEQKEKEKKRLEEEEKERLKGEREKERKLQEEEEEKKRKHQEEEEEKKRKQQEEEEEKKRKRQDEEKLQKEKTKKEEAASKGRVDRDSDSSSDSDSKSDSSSRSSRSSSSSQDKTRPVRQLKKSDKQQEVRDEKKTDPNEAADKPYPLKREVPEPSAAAVTEVEPDSESSAVAQQPSSGAEPENDEGRPEEVPMPLPLPLMVPAAYYYYHHHHHQHHQHLLHSSSSSYFSFNSCPAMPKCVAGT